MRVAFVCADPGVPVFGRKGCSVHVREVIYSLGEQGAQIELFATRFDGDPPQDLNNITIHRLPVPPRGLPAEREQAALAANRQLDHALRLAGPFDMVYERYSLWSFAAMEYAKDAAVPAVLEVNAPLIEEQAKYRELIDRAGAQRVADRVFAAAGVLVAVSDEVAAYLDRHASARGRICVIPNGVNPRRFSPRRAMFRADAELFTVGFVGTLKPWHGLAVLVEAFAQLRDRHCGARMLIVGTGPQQDTLMADLRARRLLEFTEFTGALDPLDVPRTLATMDVAVAPYLNQPGFYFSPLKVYEYMAAGLPVVASRVGQLEQLIEDGVNGLLVTPGDSGLLAAALETLHFQPQLRYRLGHAARATVLRNHTWNQVTSRILALAGIAAARTHGAVRS